MLCHNFGNKWRSRLIPRGAWLFTLLLFFGNLIDLAQRWHAADSELMARKFFLIAIQLLVSGVLASILLLGLLLRFSPEEEDADSGDGELRDAARPPTESAAPTQ